MAMQRTKLTSVMLSIALPAGGLAQDAPVIQKTVKTKRSVRTIAFRAAPSLISHPTVYP